jgi:hypothetical protein
MLQLPENAAAVDVSAVRDPVALATMVEQIATTSRSTDLHQ